MRLKQEYIETLIEKMQSGMITPEEQLLLDHWLNEKSQKSVIRYSDDTDESALQERLLKRIKKNAGIPHLPQKVRNPFLQSHYRYIAAISLLFIVSVGCFYFLGQGAVDNEKYGGGKKTAIQNIEPGHSGAVLSLANGKNIILDSLQNGKIARQGNRRIVNKSGQLVYEKMGKKRNSISGNEVVAGNGNDVMYNTLTTARGRKFQIVLSDGSKVWLNAASSITYPTSFTGKERKVAITGEAYFEIAKDSRHPFIVTAGKTEITVLGTHFNVMAYPEEKQIKTTLLKGAVRVTQGDQKMLLEPGQQAIYTPNLKQLTNRKVNTNAIVAWVKGKLALNDLTVDAIMQKISRWYDVDVKFEGSIPSGRYWGMINRDIKLSDMLNAMRAAGINVRFINNQIVVTSK